VTVLECSLSQQPLPNNMMMHISLCFLIEY